MREIKFRIWNKKVKAMGEPFTLLEGMREEIYYEGKGENLELMQYTGLKDKNGVEIYEGDIVNYGYPDEPTPHIVIFEEGGFYGKFTAGNYNAMIWGDSFEESEVIGNIYENPELLK